MSKNKENIVNINKIQNKQPNTDKIEKSIKGADVLIFNNVCAVALKYENKAPSVVYKSQDVFKSKLAANKVSLPVYKHNVASDIALTLKLGDKIKESMYVPVAEILASVYNNEKLDFDKFLNDALYYKIFKSKLHIEVGKNLKNLIKTSAFSQKIEEIRNFIISEWGLILNPIKVNLNLDLEPNKYLIQIGDYTIGEGEVYTNKCLLVNSTNTKHILFTEENPIFKIAKTWIDKKTKNDYSEKNYTIFSAQTVIAMHLCECIKNNAGDLLTRQNIYQLLEKLKSQNSENYVEDILDNVSIDITQVVLTNLLNEKVPIKEIETILETLSINSRICKSTDILTEEVRRSLSKTICEMNLTSKKELLGITLSPAIENIIKNGINTNENTLTLDPIFTENLVNSLKNELHSAIIKTGEQPVIFCSSQIRRALTELIKFKIPTLTVLSYNELNTIYKRKSIGVIHFETDKLYNYKKINKA